MTTAEGLITPQRVAVQTRPSITRWQLGVQCPVLSTFHPLVTCAACPHFTRLATAPQGMPYVLCGGQPT
jgi:hypothetical protein